MKQTPAGLDSEPNTSAGRGTFSRRNFLRGGLAAGAAASFFPGDTVAEGQQVADDRIAYPYCGSHGLLTRVLAYPKFRLSAGDRRELRADYIPYCEVVEPTERCAAVSRDGKDQPFLDLAQSGHAAVLVTGDHDLLVLAGQTRFQIETPEAYRQRASGA